MTGYPGWNFAAFDAAATALRERGDIPVSPTNVDRAIWGFNGENELKPGMDYKAILPFDLLAILTCDAIFMLRGWEKSKGALAELALAQTLELEVEFEKGAAHGRVEAEISAETT
jgi:hypothetical protein